MPCFFSLAPDYHVAGDRPSAPRAAPKARILLRHLTRPERGAPGAPGSMRRQWLATLVQDCDNHNPAHQSHAIARRAQENLNESVMLCSLNERLGTGSSAGKTVRCALQERDMALPAAACPKAPYGISFALKDLLYIRAWADRAGLSMEVLLDQVMDGAEFEELLLLRRPRSEGTPACRRALSVWRTTEGIIAQSAGGQPKLFSGVQPVTVHYAAYFTSTAQARPSFWRHLLLGG